jgi:hypothetical protein
MLLDFLSYLKEIFSEGKNLIFTLFDILGIVLFLFPHLAQGIVNNDQDVRTIGIVIALTSYLLANFSLYRKMSIRGRISENSVLLYPQHRIFSCVQLRYIGEETVKDLEVIIKYKTNKGDNIIQVVHEFSEFSATQFQNVDIKVLAENANILFRAPEKSQTTEGKVLLDVSFIGTKSEIKVSKHQELILNDRPPDQLWI